MIAFRAYGEPQTAGSKSIGYRKDGGAFVRHERAEKKRPWILEVKRAAVEAMNGQPLLEGPLQMRVTFFKPRPKGHYKTTGGLGAQGLRNPYPASRPDLDKMVRSLSDSLRGIVWRDDGQVVMVKAVKLWGEPASAMVEIDVMGPQEHRRLVGAGVFDFSHRSSEEWSESG